MKVMVAIDQTDYWVQVIEAVLKNKWPLDTQFKIVTVVAPFQWDYFSSPTWDQSVKAVHAARHDAAHKMLMEARHKLEQGIPSAQVHVELEKGSPRDRILHAAADWMPDKIFVGAHGQSPNRLLGTVPRTVASHASCSVELVRLHKPKAKAMEEKAESKKALSV